MKKFFRFIFSGAFWLNILGIIVFFVVVVLALMYFLKSYTRHGESVTIPTVVGMDSEEAIALLENENFKYEIIDTMYIDSLPKGVVVEQNPQKESLVKHGRTVYLKVNTYGDILVKMPDLVGEQYKTLSVKLNHEKLKMGNVTWQKDGDIVNIVLKQMYNGRPIEPGSEIKQGSRIDFVIAGRDPNSDEEEDEEEDSGYNFDEYLNDNASEPASETQSGGANSDE
ncbi:MAG: PASTA domain-containing protein [Bacteroidales bacterium]|nr:PASTA domain-containing protein [Bacteroidales bacterium]